MSCLTMPIGSIFLSFDIHVLDAEIPILLSLADMNKHQLIFLNPFNKVTHLPFGESGRVNLKFGHPMVTWNRFIKYMFTMNELKLLHRRFGHPTVDKLYNLLKCAKP